jgi:hypothetical protein
MRLRLLVIFAVLSVPVTAPARAHHSLREYDQTTVVTIKGTVSEVQWRNPHAQVTLRITDPNGTASTVQVEMGGPNALTKRGFDVTLLKVGDSVTFEAWQKPQDARASIYAGRSLILGDGRRFDVSDPWSQMIVAPVELPR